MVNKCIFIGRLGKDPETKFMESGKSLCKFSMAVSKKFKDKDGNQQEETEWIPISFWGKAGETIAQYVKKGDQLYVEGEFKTRSWEDDSGQKKYATEIIGNTFQFIGSKGK